MEPIQTHTIFCYSEEVTLFSLGFGLGFSVFPQLSLRTDYILDYSSLDYSCVVLQGYLDYLPNSKVR